MAASSDDGRNDQPSHDTGTAPRAARRYCRDASHRPLHGYPARCPIPLPRSGVATELAICICTTDRNPHKAFASDAAGNVGAGRGNLTIGHGKGRARRGFADPVLVTIVTFQSPS